MAFSNLAIELTEVPRAEQLNFTRLPAAYHREVRLQSMLWVFMIFLLACVPLIWKSRAGQLELFIWCLPALVLLVGALVTFLVLRKARVNAYAMREHDLAYRTGLVWRKTVLLPFSRIQHAEVSSGPLQRRFGLSTLKFYTAGGASVDLAIAGLLSAAAEQMREHILSRANLDQN